MATQAQLDAVQADEDKKADAASEDRVAKAMADWHSSHPDTEDAETAASLRAREQSDAKDRSDAGTSGMGELKEADEVPNTPAPVDQPQQQVDPRFSDVKSGSSSAPLASLDVPRAKALISKLRAPAAPMVDQPQPMVDQPQQQVAPAEPPAAGPTRAQLFAQKQAADAAELRDAQGRAHNAGVLAQLSNGVGNMLSNIGKHPIDEAGNAARLAEANAPVTDLLARRKAAAQGVEDQVKATENQRAMDMDDPDSDLSKQTAKMAIAKGMIKPSEAAGFTAGQYKDLLSGATYEESVRQREEQRSTQATAEQARERHEKVEESQGWAKIADERAKAAKGDAAPKAISDRISLKLANVNNSEDAIRKMAQSGGPLDAAGNALDPTSDANGEYARSARAYAEAKAGLEGGTAADHLKDVPPVWAPQGRKQEFAKNELSTLAKHKQEINDFYAGQGKAAPFQSSGGLQKGERVVLDPQGKQHALAAGYPVPAGWTVQGG